MEVRASEVTLRLQDPRKEFHRAWKSRLCRVEDNELRSAEAIQKWAIVLDSMDVRAVHLARAARATPDLPAATEFTDDEIVATIVLRQPKGISIEDRPPLHLVVRWIANLGGYTGKSAGSPPGVRRDRPSSDAGYAG